jgi:ABC-type antimicrobial peptide transport system permease subunit
LTLVIIFPGLVSGFLLITGLLMVMFGAVVYTDPMLASKWLPGRMSPTHVLLFGVAILLVGVLLGIIAR